MAKMGAIVGMIQALGSPDPTVIQGAVDAWLDDHPEATTTVEDGSITKAKLDSSLQGTVDDVGALKSQMSQMSAIDTAQSTDIGKALSPKTVTNGKVTEWQYKSISGGGGGGAVEDVQINGVSVVSDGVAEITLPKTETVTGATPSITGVADTRYICGECSTLAITVPATGIIDVTFTSGSTPTVLTVTPPSGVTAVKWAGGFDPTSLDADTVYEINVMDGEYGVVASWT